ncbi:MAG: gliding motility-associated C-terminal domain-containing protein, partial [Spirochaetales bacterium]|nr:gliding motility-associated C-terminal domain-containing protein [Spirochaetales bacterium]
MTMKKILKIFVLIVLCLHGVYLFGQHVEELYTPLFLGSGINAASIESPMADILNPAASGGNQRITLDLNYLYLAGFGIEPGNGFALNAGITLPTNMGVFTFNGNYLTSPFPGTNLGTMCGLHASFAKDLFPNFWVGAGLSSILGYQSDIFDWSLGLDLGFMHLLSDLGILKDFRWGMALRGLGKWYAPTANARFFPQPFSPALAVAFKLIKSETVNFTVFSDITASFYPMTNLLFNVGGEVSLFDTFALSGSYNFEMLELSDNTTERSLPLTIGLYFRFKTNFEEKIDLFDITERGWNNSEVKVNAAATPLQNGVWGIGGGINIALGKLDTSPPEVKMETGKEFYISPNLDGEQDELVLPVTITDERYVKGYDFVIADSTGKPVRTIVNKDERPENITVENLIDRLTYVKKGIKIPDAMRWDGLSDTGTVVEDGTYHYYIESWDDNGNRKKSEQGTVVVDKTPPKAEIKADYLILSPNGDGNKDVITVDGEGSTEDLWQAEVFDSKGEKVSEFKWENSAPRKFEWSGKNAEGVLVPDGVYSLKLTSRDRAGNPASYSIDNIIIDTQATPININIGLKDFSPNGDGIKDVERFNFEIPVTTGIENWSLVIKDSSGKAVKTIKGTTEIAAYEDFDGKDDGQNVLKEGTYTGELKLLYVNGNNPVATTPPFTVDLTRPSVSVNADLKVFSPNNDGNKDTVKLSQTTSMEDLWTGEIRNSSGKAVKTFIFHEKADASIEWDGRNNDGMLSPDGAYTYVLAATDRAGNSSESQPVSFEINTAETPVLLTTDLDYFSPNNDKVKDKITIVPQLKVSTGIERYEITIKNTKGEAVKSFKGGNTAPKQNEWNGRRDNGDQVPDGVYVAEINVLYTNGNNPVAKTKKFTIDTEFPTAEINAAYTLFSPDGDGELDVLEVNQETGTEDLWEGTFYNSADKSVKKIVWKNRASRFSWNGKDDTGNKLDDGLYRYVLESTDKAGNTKKVELKNIEIDTRLTSLFATSQLKAFSPNNDKYLDTMEFRFYVGLKKGIKSWKFDLVNRESGIMKTYSGETTVPESLTWDGKKDSGMADDGIYKGELMVEYHKGNKPKAGTTEFILDTTPPQLTLNLSPKPFSPDNDGFDDELTINPVIKELSGIQKWGMEILDPMKRHFTGFSGKDAPTDKIIWNGLSDKGELVQSAEDYPIEFTMTDTVGNTAKVEDLIPVDILVIRDGDKLKVRISAITFQANTADYMNVDKDKLEKNLRTIKRLSEIFNKYKQYNIRIEGHANLINWADPKKAEKEQVEDLLPLSKKRAESIKQALAEAGIDTGRMSTEGLGGSQPVV